MGRSVPAYAHALAEALWPGPLTLVVPAADDVPRFVTGGQPTVGLRCPAHPVALALIDEAGPTGCSEREPVRSGLPHLCRRCCRGHRGPAGSRARYGPGRGATPGGVESTILDCTGDAPRILRVGAVELSDVEAVTGLTVSTAPSAIRAPGGLASHYAPRARVHLQGDPAEGSGLLAPAGQATPPGVRRLAAPASTREFTPCLYRACATPTRWGSPTSGPFRLMTAALWRRRCGTARAVPRRATSGHIHCANQSNTNSCATCGPIG